MEDYPNSLPEFERRFATEEACKDYLLSIRWPEGFVCPRCEKSNSWSTKRELFHCTDCGQQTSVTAGTIFHRTRKPLSLWFRVIWHVTTQKFGANALGLNRVLNLGTYETAWEWLHKLRRAMVRLGRDRLSGVVEVDETYVGGEKVGKRGRGAEGKVLVVIGVEDKGKGKPLGRIRLQCVPDASGDSLTAFVTNNVEPGSTVRTDGWKGYNGLNGAGYDHVLAKDEADVAGEDENMLPLAHRVASLLKRWLLGTYQGAVQHSHLDYYLDEYTFRFNRRTSRSRGKLFYRLLQQAVQVDPVYGKEIRGGVESSKT